MQIVATILILVAAVLWGLVIATFSGIFSTMNPARRAFNNKLDDLNRFMRSHRLDPSLQMRLREYFIQTALLLEAQVRAGCFGEQDIDRSVSERN